MFFAAFSVWVCSGLSAWIGVSAPLGGLCCPALLCHRSHWQIPAWCRPTCSTSPLDLLCWRFMGLANACLPHIHLRLWQQVLAPQGMNWAASLSCRLDMCHRLCVAWGLAKLSWRVIYLAPFVEAETSSCWLSFLGGYCFLDRFISSWVSVFNSFRENCPFHLSFHIYWYSIVPTYSSLIFKVSPPIYAFPFSKNYSRWCSFCLILELTLIKDLFILVHFINFTIWLLFDCHPCLSKIIYMISFSFLLGLLCCSFYNFFTWLFNSLFYNLSCVLIQAHLNKLYL